MADQAIDQIKLADAHLSAQRVAEAEALYSAVLAEAPDLAVRSLVGLGRCARSRNNRAASLGFFEQAAALAPHDASRRVDVAHDLRVLKRHTAAIEAYRQAIALASAPAISADAQLGLCASLRHLGESTAALEAARAAIALRPDASVYQREFGLCLLAAKAFAEAEILFDKQLQDNPTNIAALQGLAEAARGRNDRATAARCHQQLMALEPERLQWLTRAAEDARACHDYVTAERLYNDAVNRQPDNPHNHLGLAFCLLSRGAADEALALLDTALVLAPKNSTVLAHAGDMLRRAKRFGTAELAYQRLLALSPNNIQALSGLLHCARHRGDRKEALNYGVQLIALQPKAGRWHLAMAEDFSALGDMEAAEKAFHEALACEPDLPPALAGLARRLRARGAKEDALNYTRRLIALQPANARHLIDAVSDLQALGRLDEAETQLTKAETLAPQETAVLRARSAQARLRLGPDAVIQFCRTVLEQSPEALWAKHDLATALRDLGRTAEAETIYQFIHAQTPEDFRALIGLGVCARMRGDRAAALRFFHAANSTAPSEIQPKIEIAQELRDAGDFPGARAMAQNILATAPSNLPALRSLAQTERMAGDHTAALATFTTAQAAHPGALDLLVEISLEEKNLGRITESAAHLEQALAIDPSHPGAIARLASLHMASGNSEKAYELYRVAVETRSGDIGLQTGFADTLNALGRTDEAVDHLTALEKRLGLVPRLRAKRIALLRQAGHYFEALALAHEAISLAPDQFALSLERCQCELLVGDSAAITLSLAALRPRTPGERAWMRRCLGMAAEAADQFETASRFYAAGAKLAPEDTGLQNALVRTRMITFDIERARTNLANFIVNDTANRLLRGKSMNISQTHYGQILDEYRMDQALCTELRRLQDQPPAKRVVKLLAMASPEHLNTAWSAALMVAMRQAGAMRLRTAASAPPIPHRIWQFWNHDTPTEVQKVMASWQRWNPNWQLTLFDEATARTYLAERFPSEVAEAFIRAREPAQKADLFRLAILAAEGGVYADADDRCLRPLSELLRDDASLVLYQEDIGTIGNNFIAAAPRHPIILAALQAGVDAVNRGDADVVWLSTGPGLITRALGTSMVKANQGPTLPEGCLVLHRRELLQKVAIHCFVGYKRTDKHWVQGSFATRMQRPLAAARE